MNRLFQYLHTRQRVISNLTRHHVLWLIREAGRRRADGRKATVIFVRRSARSRIYNHADSLKHTGIQSILVAQAFDYPYHKEVFSEIHPWYRASSIPGIVRKLMTRYPVKAIVSSLQPSSLTLELLKYKWPVPLLIDHHDSAWSQVYFHEAADNDYMDRDPWHSEEEVAREKICFTRVDGVIARSHELAELFRRNAVTTPVEVFEDCCSERYFQPVEVNAFPRQGEWSVAYAGMVYPMNHDPKFSFPQFADFGAIFEKEKVHFHIYPGQHHEYLYPEYEKEDRGNGYFHMHRSVDFNTIRKVLATYDFGLVGLNPPTGYRLFSPTHFKYILHAKFHTYLEAGLPIIVSRLFEHEAEIVNRYQAGLVVDMDNPRGLRKLIEKADMAGLRRNVLALRNDFLAGKQGQRLRAFIENPAGAAAASATVLPETRRQPEQGDHEIKQDLNGPG